MRVIRDESGVRWVVTVRERPGKDYKGRYYFFAKPEGADDARGVALLDVRWNSERTVARTLATMSEVELRRRLRSARGRGRAGWSASPATPEGSSTGSEPPALGASTA